MADWQKILDDNKRIEEGHWIWTGNLTKGYGVYGSNDNRILVGRIALKVYFNVELSSMLNACHKNYICDRRDCFNPEHIYPGTQSENIRDSVELGTHVSGFGEAKRNKTHCPNGHPYSGWNLMTRSDGSRRCRKCVYHQNKMRARRKKGN